MNLPSDSLETPPVPASRRHLLTVGVALAATAAGAWFALHRLRSEAAGQGVDQSALWQAKLETPAGTPLDMAAFQGKPLLLNFWATWCPPCVAEMPLIERFYQENKSKGWQVLGIAIDQAESVRRFLARTPVGYAVAMGGLQGAQISQSLGDLGGSLPYSVVFDASSRIVHRKMGALDAQELDALAARLAG